MLQAHKLPRRKSQFTPAAVMIVAAEAVLFALAEYETILPVIDAIQSRILRKNNFMPSPKYVARGIANEPVHDYQKTYRLDIADSCTYFARLDAEVAKLGYELPEGYCPALIAEGTLINAKNALIDTFKDVFGFDRNELINAVNGPKNYDKAVSVAMGIMAPFLSPVV